MLLLKKYGCLVPEIVSSEFGVKLLGFLYKRLRWLSILLPGGLRKPVAKGTALKKPWSSRRPITKGIWGFPKIRGTILVVPIIMNLVFWVLYWGPPYFGKQPYYPQ